MAVRRIRLTSATLAVLDALFTGTEAGDPVWGFKICEQTGLGPGTVYPILDRLESGSWISGAWETGQPADRPRRRLYEMTSTGRAELAAALAAKRRVPTAWGRLAQPGSPA
jgi:PadR family transcriptional regulator, regulatory protein PadR